MRKFTLEDPQFPTELISEDGEAYPIAFDHRTVLECLRVIADPDAAPLKKALMLATKFFLGKAPPDMFQLFVDFVTDDSDDDDEEERLLDFCQDAAVIYASFLQQYHIDLSDSLMHWWKFRMILYGLGDGTPLGSRVQLRTLDLDKVPEKERAKWRRRKDSVAISQKISKAEAELQLELDRRLAAGEDPTEIINKLKGV